MLGHRLIDVTPRGEKLTGTYKGTWTKEKADGTGARVRGNPGAAGSGRN